MKKITRRSLKFFLIVSVFLHVATMGGLKLAEMLRTEPKVKEVVEITLLPPEALIKNKASEKKRMQVVEQDKTQLNEEIPEDSKYLSRFNQKVKKQTRAANSGKFTNKAAPGQKVAGNPNAPEKKRKPRQKITQKSKSGTLPSLKDLLPNRGFKPTTSKEVVEAKPGDPSQTSDYLKDVDKGIQTLLSTREFVYYTYYSRIKEKIRQHWEPKIRANVKRVIEQGRTIASARDRVTRVKITLNKSGELVRIDVINQSGVLELDEAAVDSFRAAAPFPNPPKGMVEKDGTIKIHWDFVLEA